MNTFILSLKHENNLATQRIGALEAQLRDGNLDLRIKSSNQELIIDRMKCDAVRAKLEVEGLRTELKRRDDMVTKYHQKEVSLTAERDTLKRELELTREALKRNEAETGTLRSVIECEKTKKQKLRTSYRRLNESIGQLDETSEVKIALDQLREVLIG